MNEETFNTDLRKFLKRFGISAQRELETLVQQGIEAGTLQPGSVIHARARLEVDGAPLDLVIEEELRIGS
jgi:hypothetical protein